MNTCLEMKYLALPQREDCELIHFTAPGSALLVPGRGCDERGLKLGNQGGGVWGGGRPAPGPGPSSGALLRGGAQQVSPAGNPFPAGKPPGWEGLTCVPRVVSTREMCPEPSGEARADSGLGSGGRPGEEALPGTLVPEDLL